jgi:exodeoxyribonuclease VIII
MKVHKRKPKATAPKAVVLPTKPGMYDGIPFTDYCLRLKGANSTMLRQFLHETPSRVYYLMTHPEKAKDSVALRLGHATHAAVLEPERFEEEYARIPKFDLRTNEGKAGALKWAEDHPTQARLLPDKYDETLAMRDALLAHPLASKLLGAPGRTEVTVLFSIPVWKNRETGEIACQPESPGKGFVRAGEVACKARIDKLISWENWSTVLDLKTDRDASLAGFGKACEKFSYHAQAAMYLDALDILAPRKRRFIHVVVDKRPPHDVAVRELDEPELREGRAAYRFALATYIQCKKSGVWPAYFDGIEPQEMRRSAFRFTDPTQ